MINALIEIPIHSLPAFLATQMWYLPNTPDWVYTCNLNLGIGSLENNNSKNNQKGMGFLF